MKKPENVKPNLADIRRAAQALREGKLVAFPTETVYGLGADASNPDAVRHVFALKGRPTNHPLILHIADAKSLAKWARDIPEAAHSLAKAFMPGPLSLVLKRSAFVSDLITGGQDTVAIRIPAHPTALALLSEFGGGIVAPSANRFGRISPTRAEHVRADFPTGIAQILDGGACDYGLESTILDMTGDKARVLRPGALGQVDLAEVLGYTPELSKKPKVKVSGSLASHYAPITPTSVTALEAIPNETTTGVLAREEKPAQFKGIWTTMPKDVKSYAQTLYAALRELDTQAVKHIYIEDLPSEDAWLAIKDRVTRASHNTKESLAHVKQ